MPLNQNEKFKLLLQNAPVAECFSYNQQNKNHLVFPQQFWPTHQQISYLLKICKEH